ncbi:MAG: M17 family peptidase N-terminal domain-containing protein, partial [Acidimicrobiales bacterium]
MTAELARIAPDDVDAIAVGAVADQLEGEGVDWGFLAANGFVAKPGDVRALPGPDGRTVYVVGLGKAADVTADTLRHAAGSVARAAKHQSSIAVDLLGHLGEGASVPRAAQAIVEGLVLGGYKYGAFKSEPKLSKLERLVVVGGGGQRVQTAIDRGLALAETVCWVRDLENEPGGSLTPTRLAQIAAKVGETDGFEVTVWDKDDIRKEKLG